MEKPTKSMTSTVSSADCVSATMARGGTNGANDVTCDAERPPSAGPQAGAAVVSPHSCSLILDHRVECFRFFVPGMPVAKSRPRMTRTGHTYTPQNSVDFENRVRMSAHDAIQTQAIRTIEALPYDVPLHATVDIRLAPLKTWPLWKTTWLTLSESTAINPDPVPGVPHVSRPDMDNIVKAIFDGLNGVVYRDDSLIASLFVTKAYATTPGVRVILSPLATHTKDSIKCL